MLKLLLGGSGSGKTTLLYQRIRARAEAGERLTLEDALALYEENDLLFLAACARAAKERASGRSVASRPGWCRRRAAPCASCAACAPCTRAGTMTTGICGTRRRSASDRLCCRKRRRFLTAALCLGHSFARRRRPQFILRRLLMKALDEFPQQNHKHDGCRRQYQSSYHHHNLPRCPFSPALS